MTTETKHFCISVILSEDWVGGAPIQEQLIRDGKITTISKPRSVPTILNIPGTHLISVTQVISGKFLFYIGWKK